MHMSYWTQQYRLMLKARTYGGTKLCVYDQWNHLLLRNTCCMIKFWDNYAYATLKDVAHAK